MRKILIITFGLITFSLFGLTTVWAISFDFESGCGSSPAPAGCVEIVSTPAFSTNVAFGKSLNGINIVSLLGAPGPPFSPSRSARWDPTAPTTPDDPYRADFLISGVNFVSVVLGDNGGDIDQLFLNAFKTDGTFIGGDSKTLPANAFGGFVLSVSAPNIAYVEFGRNIGQAGEGNSVLFDNFTYQTSNTPIPEPSTALMIASGLLGLTIWRIRQNKKTC